MNQVSPGIYSHRSNLRWGLVPEDEAVMHWNVVDRAFKAYTTTRTRTEYLEIIQSLGITDAEGILLWQGFDRAEEQWRLKGCSCWLVDVIRFLSHPRIRRYKHR